MTSLPDEKTREESTGEQFDRAMPGTFVVVASERNAWNEADANEGTEKSLSPSRADSKVNDRDSGDYDDKEVSVCVTSGEEASNG